MNWKNGAPTTVLCPEKERVVQYYQEVDESYQHWGHSEGYEIHYGYRDSLQQDHFTALIRMNEVMAEKGRIGHQNTVLDAGCGVGASSIWMAKKLGARAYGISLSPLQVKKAKEFSRIGGVDSLTDFSEQDYTNTQFPDEFFDTVWALESVCHSPSKRDFIEEAYRVLKPGGRLVVGDYFQTKNTLEEMDQFALEKWCEGWALPGLPIKRTFEKDLNRLYSNLEIFDITEQIRKSAEDIYNRGRKGYPADILEKGKNILQIKHVEACIFQKVALDLELWRYLIVAAVK